MIAAPDRGERHTSLERSDRGVTLVEFALVIPIVIIALLALIEFGFALNAVLAINRASQEGAVVAGQAGNDAAADCIILAHIDDFLGAPLDRRDVREVRLVRTGTTGSGSLASTVYVRSGRTTCGDAEVPYTATSTGYPPAQRCNVLAGCPQLSPPRSTLDKITVEITYRHTAVTPLRELLRMFGGDGALGATWTFTKRNTSRMEPVQ
jgi:Flp pilus assembly protein TadG